MTTLGDRETALPHRDETRPWSIGRVTVALRSDRHAPRRARRLLRRALRGDPRVDRAELATSELVTNVVRYGQQHRATIFLSWSVTDGTLRVEVRQPNVSIIEMYGLSPTEDDPTGRGLQIVYSVTDRCGQVHSSGTTVWFEIDAPDSVGEFSEFGESRAQ